MAKFYQEDILGYSILIGRRMDPGILMRELE